MQRLILIIGLASCFIFQGDGAFAGCDCQCKDAKGQVHPGDKLNAPDLKDLAKRCRDTCGYVYDQPMEPVGACMGESLSPNASAPQSGSRPQN